MTTLPCPHCHAPVPVESPWDAYGGLVECPACGEWPVLTDDRDGCGKDGFVLVAFDPVDFNV